LKKKYSGLSLRELRELRQLREENSKLKHLVADLSGPAYPPGDRAKKAVRPRHRRELGRWTQTVFALSTRRVSELMMINRSTMNYRSGVIRSTRCERGCESWRRAECVSVIDA
jgi:putative transposase